MAITNRVSSVGVRVIVMQWIGENSLCADCIGCAYISRHIIALTPRRDPTPTLSVKLKLTLTLLKPTNPSSNGKTIKTYLFDEYVPTPVTLCYLE